jgi:hypothetical protein
MNEFEKLLARLTGRRYVRLRGWFEPIEWFAYATLGFLVGILVGGQILLMLGPHWIGPFSRENYYQSPLASTFFAVYHNIDGLRYAYDLYDPEARAWMITEVSAADRGLEARVLVWEPWHAISIVRTREATADETSTWRHFFQPIPPPPTPVVSVYSTPFPPFALAVPALR